MKRREFIKAGLITAGAGLAEFMFPSESNGLESMISGRIMDTLSESPVYGAKLKFYDSNNNLVFEAESDENGIFPTGVAVGDDKWIDVKKLFNNAPEFNNLRKIALEKRVAKRADNGILKLEIKHDDYFDAVRYVDLSKSEFNSDIIPKSFDMELFDMWCRDPFLGGCIQRWEEQPKWYIWTDMANEEQIDLVKEIINNDLVQFSNGFINAPVIEKNENPPNLNDLNGKVIVMWDNSGGPGFHYEDLDGNKIYSGGVQFNLTGPLRVVYLEELTQVLGPRTETETRNFWDASGQYLPVAKDIGKILFKKPIGSKSPDIDPTP